MCLSSPWSDSGLVQTTLALWVSVPMTLYLEDRLWWLSHCKYWSVWVGFWYTWKDKELSANGVTRVSRKGMAPFSWLSSTVNLIAGSTLLMCSRNSSLWAYIWMIHVSSTNRNMPGGVDSRTQSFSLKTLHIQIGNNGTYRWSHRHSFNLLIEPALKEK